MRRTLDGTIDRQTRTLRANDYADVPPLAVDTLATAEGCRALLWTAGPHALAMFEDIGRHARALTEEHGPSIAPTLRVLERGHVRPSEWSQVVAWDDAAEASREPTLKPVAVRERVTAPRTTVERGASDRPRRRYQLEGGGSPMAPPRRGLAGTTHQLLRRQRAKV
jgi:hypothetical protein